MRSLLMLPMLLVLASACSQNPHVDVSPEVDKTQAAAVQTPDSKLVNTKDQDQDGVLDSADQCPTEPGPAENNGCPYPEWQDFDRDGIPDAEDRCPSVPGPAANDGCPFAPGAAVDPDSDHDFVPDRFDRCPNVPGLVSNDGCPLRGRDWDHDGVPDSLDRCPRIPGPASNDGCPLPREEERRVLLQVKESLKFDFDKASIKPESFPALRRLVDFMERYPTSHLRMVGHTDEVGTAQYNDDLSQARVESVKEYLVEHGIDEGRISASARGEREPLVSEEGKMGEALDRARAINRRVDMSVRYEGFVRVAD